MITTLPLLARRQVEGKPTSLQGGDCLDLVAVKTIGLLGSNLDDYGACKMEIIR